MSREMLVEGRAFFCWDNAKKEGYFPLVCKEDVRKRAPKIKVMCLMPAEDAPGALHTRAGAFKFAMYKLQCRAVEQASTSSTPSTTARRATTGRTRRCARSSSTRLASRERRGGRWTAGTEGSVRGGLSGCSGGREASHGGHTIHACAQYSCSLTSV